MITVLPFESLEVSAAVARSVSGLVETNLVNSGAYTVLSQNERARILEAQEASLADCAEEGCAIRIGKLLSAEQIVIGTVAALGSRFIVNAKIIDVATSRTVAADSVSAPSVEELEEATRALTRSLVAASAARLAAPGEPRAPESGTPGQAGGERDETGPEAGAGTASGVLETQQPPETVDTAVTARGPGALAYLALPGAVLAAELGSLARSIGFELQLKSEAAYQEYEEAPPGSDSTALYDSYQSAYNGHLLSQILAYSFWGVGGTSAAAAYFLFPPDTYTLSRSGRASFHVGLSLLAAGGAFSMVGDNLAYRGQELWAEYAAASAGDDFDALYGAYSANHAWYSACRITSYSLWALGGLGVAGSFLLPGERQPVAPSALHRVLLAAGTGAIVLGGLTHSVAQSLRVRAIAAEGDYLEAPAGSDFEALYAEYERYHGWYVANSVLSYVLWGGGAAAVLTSMFLRPAGGERAAAEGQGRERPVELFLVPSPHGLFLQMRLMPQGGGK